MKKEQVKEKRKRLVILLLLLLIPTAALILLYVNLKPEKTEAPKTAGINTTLPGTQAEKNPLDKLSIYIQADKDSAKRAEQISRDPYYQQLAKDSLSDRGNIFNPFNVNNEVKRQSYSKYGSNSSNEYKINLKISELEKQMATNGETQNVKYKESMPAIQEIRKKELKNPEDPEIEQLNSMLEKILDIQHPERVQDRLEANNHDSGIIKLPVYGSQDECSVDCIVPPKESPIVRTTTNKFYESGELQVTSDNNVISANIHNTETIIPGSTVKLRLNQDMFIGSSMVPKGAFVFGVSSLYGDRLKITINTIAYNNSIYPVELSVYSLDGMEGILIPGVISRDVAQQSASKSANSFQMAALDQSFKAQAATAGVEAVKSFIGKKVKVVQITVKAGPVLLRSGKTN